MKEPMPPLPPGYNMPFYYSTLSIQWIYFEVEPDALRPYVAKHGPGLDLVFFAGSKRAVAVLVFMKYGAQFNDSISVTLEAELNAMTYPVARRDAVPAMSLEAFLAGNDQTKTIGQLRLFVPADNPVAVEAGRKLFNEPKFLAQFQVDVPALNSPGVSTWSVSCYAPAPGGDTSASPDPSRLLYTANADLRGLTPAPGNGSQVIRYTGYEDRQTGEKRPLGSRWNYPTVFESVMLGAEGSRRVQVTPGPSAYEGVSEAMKNILGTGVAVAVQTYDSPLAAIESRGFYADV